jgi:hypothetical protein
MSEMGPIITLVVVVIAIVIAWKVLTGLVKTVVLLGILALAALYVFGGGMV